MVSSDWLHVSSKGNKGKGKATERQKEKAKAKAKAKDCAMATAKAKATYGWRVKGWPASLFYLNDLHQSG